MKKMRRITAMFLAAVFTVQLILAVPAGAAGADSKYSQLDRKLDLITEMLLSDKETTKTVADLGRAVVTISVSDGEQKAQIVSSSSKTLNPALKFVREKVKTVKLTPKWVKLDVMTAYEEISYDDFIEKYKGSKGSGMRRGIAFNDYFGTVLLEAQINSDGLMDYETGTLDLERINSTLERIGKKKISSIPSKLYLFDTQGYFCENSSYALKLTAGSDGTTGRRATDMDLDFLETMAQHSSDYLCSICDEDGKFIYGYYPIDNEIMNDYNIIRHAGTVWNLIMQYDMCGDSSIVPVIDRAMHYLNSEVKFRNKNTAFLKNGGLLNVGGTGLALIAYCMYAQVFSTTKYNRVIDALANGICFMQKDNGGYVHEMDAQTYEVTSDYVVVFYDGEAMYGTLMAYGILGKSKHLQSARRAADYFIEQNYSILHSHWISYAFNELTKYDTSEKYLEFGLQNVNSDRYAAKVGNSKTAGHTSAETINTAFEIYDRIVKNNYKCDYINEFYINDLLTAIEKKMQYGLNYFMFPEYAMYFEAPETVLYTFAVREDKFRIRIDDIQHFMDGYYLYWKNYNSIKAAERDLADL